MSRPKRPVTGYSLGVPKEQLLEQLTWLIESSAVVTPPELKPLAPPNKQAASSSSGMPPQQASSSHNPLTNGHSAQASSTRPAPAAAGYQHQKQYPPAPIPTQNCVWEDHFPAPGDPQLAYQREPQPQVGLPPASYPPASYPPASYPPAMQSAQDYDVWNEAPAHAAHVQMQASVRTAAGTDQASTIPPAPLPSASFPPVSMSAASSSYAVPQDGSRRKVQFPSGFDANEKIDVQKEVHQDSIKWRNIWTQRCYNTQEEAEQESKDFYRGLQYLALAPHEQREGRTAYWARGGPSAPFPVSCEACQTGNSHACSTNTARRRCSL